MTIWDCPAHVRMTSMTSSVERTDLDFKISVALLYSPAPTLLYYNLRSITLPSHPLPTYLLSHPYHTLHSLPSPRLLPISSHPLPYPLPYHIPPDSPAPTLLYSSFYYSFLASPPLPIYPRTPILPLHRLPSAPLASPPLFLTLPYHIHPDWSRGRNVSFPTSTLTLPYSTLLSPTAPTPPYPTLPIYFLPFHSSTLASHPLHSSPLP